MPGAFPSLPVRLQSVVESFKRQRWASMNDECDICEWAPMHVAGSWRLFRGHHIVPIKAGGCDDHGNLMLLCPNCHTLVHFLWSLAGGVWNGPRTAVDTIMQVQHWMKTGQLAAA